MAALPPSLSRALERDGEGLVVLVVRLAAMGDILRTLPAVRLIARALPASRIHWAVDDRWSRVLAGVSELEGIVAFPRAAGQKAGRSPAGLLARVRLARRWRREVGRVEPSLSLDFHGNLRSGLTAWLAGATLRLGYEPPQSKELNRFFNTHFVPAAPLRTPRLERNLAMVRWLGLPDSPLPLGNLPLVAAGRERASAITRAALGDRPYAVISPGASRAQAYKKPPAAHLAAAVPVMAAAGLGTLVVWGPGEEEDARRVVALAGGQATLAPDTDLATLAALISRAQLYLGGDSGPLHLACAIGCRVVAVYGPTDPVVNGPWGVPARAVFPAGRAYTGIKSEDRRRGFEGLEPSQVASAVSEVLALPRADAGVAT